MFNGDYTIRAVDPELWGAIQTENERQHNHIQLIASENYAGPAVMEAQGSQLTNKYARGNLVDEQALALALKSGVIGGTGFDVLTSEPPKDSNASLGIDLPNFILTSHIAWASQKAMRILAEQLIDNIEAFVAGRPQNVVTERL
jgi:hypothetical protein